MTLFSELRRRNVLRMAAFYLAAAWLVMQVAEVLMGLGKLPDVVGLWVLAMLAIGFPIALVVSWFWDITPEGIVRDAELPEAGPTPAVSGRRVDFVIIAMLVAAVVLLLVWDPPASGDDAITVLPFESPMAPDDAAFAEGISSELQSKLAQLKRFMVKLPPAAPIRKKFDIPQMAREMNVRWVLAGDVRRAGSRVRISAAVIDAANGAVIAWSGVFDRELSATNLLDIQEEIAREISIKIGVPLDEPAKQRLAARPTQNTEAYSAYVLGRQRLKGGKIADTVDAIEQFTLAIELDPQFAVAYSGLADACSEYGQSHEHCPSSAAGREQLARKALELDPESGEAWISLGDAIFAQSIPTAESIKDKGLAGVREGFREAVAAIEHGLELNPTLTRGYESYGRTLMWVHVYPDPPYGWIRAWQSGRWEAVFDKGLEIDPLSLSLHGRKTWYPITVRSKEEAMWHGHRMIEIAPDSPIGYATVADLERTLNGRIDEWVRWNSKAMAIDPERSAYPGELAAAYAVLGDPDMTLAYLELAKALAAPGNQRGLERQIRIQLVTGQIDAPQVAELLTSLGESESTIDFVPSPALEVFVDLAIGRPEDALARIETDTREDYAAARMCLGATEIPAVLLNCPDELVRVYQELGDHKAAQALSDAIVRRGQLWVDEVGTDGQKFGYAGSLATAGRTDEALDVLENLVSSDLRSRRFSLCCSVRFDAIRDHPRFRAIVAAIEADMAQQLENVRAMQRRGEVPTLEEVQALIASAHGSD